MYLIWEQLVFLSLPWIRRSKQCAWKWISEHVLFSGWGWIILYLLPRDSHKQPLQVDECLFSLGCVWEQNKPSWIIRFYGYAVSNNFLKKPNYILLISKPCCPKRRILRVHSKPITQRLHDQDVCERWFAGWETLIPQSLVPDIFNVKLGVCIHLPWVLQWPVGLEGRTTLLRKQYCCCYFRLNHNIRCTCRLTQNPSGTSFSCWLRGVFWFVF